QRQRFEALADTLEPRLRDAFRSAVDDIRSNADLGRIVERLEAGDINGALAALNIDRAAFGDFDDTMRDAYVDGGRAILESQPRVPATDGGRVVVRFDARAPRAER